jgi:hypothetical protein
MLRLLLVIITVLVSCRQPEPPSETPITVLAWPAGECAPDLTIGETALDGEIDAQKRLLLLKGMQVFFADYLRQPERPPTCIQPKWIPYCVRREHIDSFFVVDSITATDGDKIGFADIRFRNGRRFRMCLNGCAYPLDGANFTEGQERCPKGDGSRRKALPADCWQDSARLLKALGPY